ncbi:GtrA family protein [Mucilaginibacter pedocola]|uniref:GtrA/DPMS transmembrane domain-containing protein n=1 Tax=Mucilaginibacter pedocola TaxID=1792845 RepID=A0A1S9PL08_9SPHI|nr:GtrA family protein [Mucilaginibacter pedocola]OOQ61652.1 hypothetical protein BC343_00825 [Mucilaginibacter pedocola]
MANSVLQKLAKNSVLRFLLSAGTGFLADMVAFYLLFHFVFTDTTYSFGFTEVRNSSISLAISYTLGVCINFLMTKFLVFKQSKSSPVKQFIRFASVAFLGFFANLGVLKLLIQEVGIYPPYARAGAALSLFVASYFVHKAFSFSLSLRQHQPHDTQPHHQPGN